ncbi:MAG: outer membrane protein assembly factor BamE [Candidatus Competibacterales bacterium]
MIRLPFFVSAWLVAGFVALSSGCAWMLPSFYQIDIPQGNELDTAQVQRLRPGLTKGQVRTLLGSPLLNSPFHRDRWDYVYTLRQGGEAREWRHVRLYFEGNTLTRIEGDFQNALDPTPEAEEPLTDEPVAGDDNSEAESPATAGNSAV